MPAAELAALYRTSPDRELREQVLLAFSQSGESAAIDALLSIALGETDPELRHRAVFWLGQTDDPRADELLEEILLEE